MRTENEYVYVYVYVCENEFENGGTGNANENGPRDPISSNDKPPEPAWADSGG